MQKLPDPKICRTRRLFETGYFLCLVDDPGTCPQLNIIRGTFICNHHFRRNFSEEADVRRAGNESRQ